MEQLLEKYVFSPDSFIIKDDALGIDFVSPSCAFQQVQKTYENGTIYFEQYVSDGQLHGPSRAYFSNGSLASEHWFVQGAFHGRVLLYTPSGDIVYKGGYRNGKKHGKFFRKREDGSLLATGSYVDGIPEGKFLLYGKDGLLLQSVGFHDGRRDDISYGWTEDNFALFCERWENGEKKETILPDPLIR